MNNRLFRYVLIIIGMVIVLAGILYLTNGSLEMVPSEEQQGKARILGAILVLAGCGLGFVGARIKNGENSSDPASALNYYNEHAAEFVAGTENADVSELREHFLTYVPEGGSILDWGCGSGRDAAAFLQAGYRVDATDGSGEIAALASRKTGIAVKNQRFDALAEVEKYDGIWACASLLHVDSRSIPSLLLLAERALRPGGAMYASFKYGGFEGWRNGRFFTDMTEDRFAEAARDLQHLTIVETWTTADVRPGRAAEKWLNVILQKK